MKVRATSEYVRRNLADKELGRIPQIGEEFEVTKERYDFLNGNNSYKAVFVEAVEEVEVAVKEENAEKAVRNTAKRAK